jgi:nitroimidazol reductase NimA-like FMN-containing flavoprotein (pyridoxamine 5'-phosphate oxidase superfamily)
MMQREHRPADRIRIRRNPKKGRYEPATIDAILDRGLVAHVAFVDRREPVCIQMLYGRIDRKLYIHGSRASRMMRLLAAGRQACLTVTLMQGLVIARSAFEHSANYESVVVFGRFAAIEGDDERLAALAAFTNKLLPGRWDEVRQPNAKELNRAGVARATVFSRFGSKLGVLEALSMRCAGGPEMRAVREAQRVEDPVAAVEALLVAGCDLWEKEGYIMVQLKAIAVLEPDASRIIDEQYDDQRSGMEALARGLQKARTVARRLDGGTRDRGPPCADERRDVHAAAPRPRPATRKGQADDRRTLAHHARRARAA